MMVPRRGFTLVEMAIVMLVIGILAAGAIFAGKSVLARGRVASLLSSVKDLASASRDFKTRFGYYPGDLPNAGTYITTNGGIFAPCIYAPASTIGNGIVDTATESDCALEHLSKAGMLSKLDYDSTTNKYTINSLIGPGVQVSLWFNALTNENVVRITNLPCDAAIELDGRFDSATTTNTPFNQGFLIAQDGAGAPLANCIQTGTPGGPVNDPVPTVLIKY